MIEPKLQQLTATKNAKEKVHKDLLQQKKSTLIACDKINKNLQYIFFSTTRLIIEPVGDNYVIKSNGKPVTPSNISIGERNALALCYFMTDISKGLNEHEIFTQPRFLIIDDPITSFDKENRVGVLSFLKSQFLRMFKGNVQSRLILLSHDFCTVLDLEKVCSEILKSIPKDHISGQYAMISRELSHWKIQEFRSKSSNEYSKLLKMVFEYGNDQQDDFDPYIGNMMRRIFEAFTTFEYRKGMSGISCDSKILKSLNNPEYETYFENLMCRLVLDSESHTQDGIRSLNNINFFDSISMSEKKRTARDVLCFMHLLHPNHVGAHLEENEAIIATIVRWEKTILGNQ